MTSTYFLKFVFIHTFSTYAKPEDNMKVNVMKPIAFIAFPTTLCLSPSPPLVHLGRGSVVEVDRERLSRPLLVRTTFTLERTWSISSPRSAMGERKRHITLKTCWTRNRTCFIADMREYQTQKKTAQNRLWLERPRTRRYKERMIQEEQEEGAV